MRFTRITVDPLQMGGLPCIRGLRIPVSTVVSMIAEGMTEAEILEAYPDLTLEDIAVCCRGSSGADGSTGYGLMRFMSADGGRSAGGVLRGGSGAMAASGGGGLGLTSGLRGHFR